MIPLQHFPLCLGLELVIGDLNSALTNSSYDVNTLLTLNTFFTGFRFTLTPAFSFRVPFLGLFCLFLFISGISYHWNRSAVSPWSPDFPLSPSWWFQSRGFKYISTWKIVRTSISSARLSPKFQIHTSIHMFGISTYTPKRHFDGQIPNLTLISPQYFPTL